MENSGASICNLLWNLRWIFTKIKRKHEENHCEGRSILVTILWKTEQNTKHRLQRFTWNPGGLSSAYSWVMGICPFIIVLSVFHKGAVAVSWNTQSIKIIQCFMFFLCYHQFSKMIFNNVKSQIKTENACQFCWKYIEWKKIEVEMNQVFKTDKAKWETQSKS